MKIWELWRRISGLWEGGEFWFLEVVAGVARFPGNGAVAPRCIRTHPRVEIKEKEPACFACFQLWGGMPGAWGQGTFAKESGVLTGAWVPMLSLLLRLEVTTPKKRVRHMLFPSCGKLMCAWDLSRVFPLNSCLSQGRMSEFQPRLVCPCFFPGKCRL